jgi:CheY-like chemotaxis protein
MAEGEVGTGLTALVAEDHPGYRERVTASLRAAGLRCVVTEDGADAIAFLEGGGAADLLVTDLEMPRRDGWAVIEAWLGSGRPVETILLLTGEADRRDVRERCTAHSVRLLHKLAFESRFGGALIELMAAVKCDDATSPVGESPGGEIPA